MNAGKGKAMNRRKNLPNILTMSRIFMAMGFIYFLSRAGLAALITASLLFILAALTDFFDGYYARKHNFITRFGKIMDPVADKFLTLAAFYLFAQMHIFAQWMFYLIMIRELTVTGSRLIAMRQGQVLAAEKSGKTKTVAQIVTILFVLALLILKEAGVLARAEMQTGYDWAGAGGLMTSFLMVITVALTLTSGLEYFWNNRRIFLLRPAA